MPSFDYAKSRLTAHNLITKFGQTGAIKRVTPGAGGTLLNPAPGVTTYYPCTLVILEYSRRDRAEGLVGATDKRAFVSAQGLEVTPTSGDRLVVGGKKGANENTWSGGEDHGVIEIQPLSPAGVTVFYEMRVAW